MKNKKLICLVIIVIIAIIALGSLIYFNTTNVETIILDGTYSEGATDEIYKFTSDGRVILGYSLDEYNGTYTTVEENTIEINLTEHIHWDIDTDNEIKETFNQTLNVKYINENTLEVINDDYQITYQITKIN